MAADFIDHADGANRPDKTAVILRFLKKHCELKLDPDLIERYNFYLAQSYFELADFEKAAEHYKKRVDLGGFDEERWYAQMRYAQCLGQTGRSAQMFCGRCCGRFEMRPQRAEVLYELAKVFPGAG